MFGLLGSGGLGSEPDPWWKDGVLTPRVKAIVLAGAAFLLGLLLG